MQGLCGNKAGIMSQYFIYYVESSIICLIIFGIMLGHNRSTVDRSEKVAKYDGALIAFMLYFVSDAIWILQSAPGRDPYLLYNSSLCSCTAQGFR